MPTVFKTRIIKIGNSQGLRIPKPLLEQTNMTNEVELEVQPNQIVIRQAHPARHNWEDACKTMAHLDDDQLLDGTMLVPTTWDDEEWEW